MVRSVSSWLEVRTGRNKGSVHMWAAAFGPGLELLCGPQRQEGGVSGYSPQEVDGGSESSFPCGYIQVGDYEYQ